MSTPPYADRRAPLMESLESRRLLSWSLTPDSNVNLLVRQTGGPPMIVEEQTPTLTYTASLPDGALDFDLPVSIVAFDDPHAGANKAEAEDYTISEQSFAIPKGETSHTFEVTIVNDDHTDDQPEGEAGKEYLILGAEATEHYAEARAAHPAYIHDGTGWMHKPWEIVETPDLEEPEHLGQSDDGVVDLYKSKGWRVISLAQAYGGFGETATVGFNYSVSDGTNWGYGGSAGINLSGLGVPFQFGGNVNQGFSTTETTGSSFSKSRGGPHEPNRRYFLTAGVQTIDAVYITQTQPGDGDAGYEADIVRLGYQPVVDLYEVWAQDKVWADPDADGVQSTLPMKPDHAQHSTRKTLPTGLTNPDVVRFKAVPPGVFGADKSFDDLFDEDSDDDKPLE